MHIVHKRSLKFHPLTCHDLYPSVWRRWIGHKMGHVIGKMWENTGKWWTTRFRGTLFLPAHMALHLARSSGFCRWPLVNWRPDIRKPHRFTSTMDNSWTYVRIECNVYIDDIPLNSRKVLTLLTHTRITRNVDKLYKDTKSMWKLKKLVCYPLVI